MNDKEKPIFTVFTPTFNRAHILSRAYHSLCQQTYKNFEWLIIDDGSTDETEALVKKWQEQSTSFNIRYFYQDNKHKKTAHNKAVSKAFGQYMVVLDSDDALLPNALITFLNYWKTIPVENWSQYFCVCGLCIYPDGKVVGDRYPTDDYFDSNSLESYYKYKIKGEKLAAMRTDVLADYLFEETIPGLVPEGTVWNRIAHKYKTRYFNEAVRIYNLDGDGLTQRVGQKKNIKPHAPGALLLKKQLIENDLKYFKYSPKDFLVHAINVTRYWLYCKSETRALIGYLPKNSLGKVLVIIVAPIGFIAWLIEKVGAISR